MKKTLVIAAVLFLISTTSALDLNQSQLDQYKQEYNQGDVELPSAVGSLVADQRINVYLENQTLGAVMNDTQIQRVNTSEVDNPGIEVWVEEEAVESLRTSDSPRQALKEALDTGTIDYEVHGFLNKIKFWVAELFL